MDILAKHIPTIAAAVLLLGSAAPARAQEASPVGLWRTVDDHTGKERGLVRIGEANGVLYGRVEKIFDPVEAARICVKCTDDRKGKPILGLDILRGLKPDGANWGGGEIVDPETGNVYSASAKVIDGGKHLVLRGYLLISLLGRSQTWTREPS